MNSKRIFLMSKPAMKQHRENLKLCFISYKTVHYLGMPYTLAVVLIGAPVSFTLNVFTINLDE
jgi:hypothetical protein